MYMYCNTSQHNARSRVEPYKYIESINGSARHKYSGTQVHGGKTQVFNMS